MQRAAALALTLALTAQAGCVTGAWVWKRDNVSLPMLGGAVAADLVVTTVIASQVQDFTVGASLGTAAAVATAGLIGFVGLGACHSLRL